MKEKKNKLEKKASGFFSDFKKFIARGNVMDLAVAVIVGGAFGKIVSSLVADIIMPLITGLLGNISIVDLKWVIAEATETRAEVAVAYGNFLQTVIDFLIIAFFVFVFMRVVIKAKNVTETITKKIKTDKGVVEVKQEVPKTPTPQEETNILLKQILVELSKDEISSENEEQQKE